MSIRVFLDEEIELVKIDIDLYYYESSRDSVKKMNNWIFYFWTVSIRAPILRAALLLEFR